MLAMNSPSCRLFISSGVITGRKSMHTRFFRDA